MPNLSRSRHPLNLNSEHNLKSRDSSTKEPGGQQLSYRDAGVDIDAGEQLVENIKPLAKRTSREGVLAGVGGFGALFEIPKRFKEPVLVTGTDGVGTKLKLATQLGKHDTIGIDLVAMSVNDILVQGAEPLFFLDYFSCGKLDVTIATDVVKGIARGCELARCALIGGETAEMPGMYAEGDYDLAGFAVGAVEKSQIIDGMSIGPGDVVLGLASSGPHSNGYSLIRKLLESSGTALTDRFGDATFADVLLQPTTIYVKPVLDLLARVNVKGMSHITGGGLLENIPRVLPETVTAEVNTGSWEMPPVFHWLRDTGGLDAVELYRTFNCGVGYVVIVAAADAQAALVDLNACGQTAWRLGQVRERSADEAQVLLTEY